MDYWEKLSLPRLFSSDFLSHVKLSQIPDGIKSKESVLIDWMHAYIRGLELGGGGGGALEQLTGIAPNSRQQSKTVNIQVRFRNEQRCIDEFEAVFVWERERSMTIIAPYIKHTDRKIYTLPA